MRPSAKKKKPEIIIRDGKPTAVILDIEEYREKLERLEDVQDIKMLERMRARKLSFRKLDDFLESRPLPALE
jgi:PHD/YefM family antitoxin component YafN of YafNO toxin-antitoxin module